MKSTRANQAKAAGLMAAGIAVCVVCIRVGDADDAPGLSLLGILILIGAGVLAVRLLRRGA